MPPTEHLEYDAESPPKAALAFRVGIVGHRPHRLQQADLLQLRDVLTEILKAVRSSVLSESNVEVEMYGATPPVLRALSPLAEGADRLFAECALDLDYELCCIMPFHQAEFEADFSTHHALEDNSLERFRAILNRAQRETRLVRFELDGVRQSAESAYATGGRVVVNQSDLLIVVWDGMRQHKRGGTEETFDFARHEGVPVICVDAHAPHAWIIVDAARPLSETAVGQRTTAHDQTQLKELENVMRGLLRVPARASNGRLMTDFYSERWPSWNPALLWSVFHALLGKGRWPRLRLSVGDFESAIDRQWPRDTSSAVGQMIDHLRPFYGWSDQLAALYSDRYRSAFVAAFLLAAAAVGLSLLPFGFGLEPHGGGETLSIAGELLAILMILGLVWYGRNRRWHERWIEYRLTAELIRHLRLVAPLGGGRPFPQVPAQWSAYGSPGATWMAWYVRTVERHLGLPSVVVDRQHLASCLSHLAERLDRQIEWHAANARSSHRIEKLLHRAGICLLLLTLFACALHLLPGVQSEIDLPSWLPARLLTFVCCVFPALGAALAGISNQAEFRRIAKRSRAMVDQLRPLKEQVDQLFRQLKTTASPPRQYSVDVERLSRDAARLLVNEVLDWRVVFLDRPLVPPA